VFSDSVINHGRIFESTFIVTWHKNRFERFTEKKVFGVRQFYVEQSFGKLNLEMDVKV
jgi:hypothetical protein